MKKRFLLFLIAIAILSGCVPEPQHSNPLDPFNRTAEDDNLQIAGEILQKIPPHAPLEDCMVLLLPSEKFDYTNTNGRFTFTNLAPGIYQIILNKTGYASDTISVNPDTLSSSPIAFYMDGIPQIKKLRIYSEFVDQWYPDPFFRIWAELIVDDPDGVSDIISEQLSIPDLNMTFDFGETSLPDSFSALMKEADFPENNIFSIVGKEVLVRLEDQSGAVLTSTANFVHRIIETAPVPESPTGLDPVTPTPLFTWEPYLANFDFTYEVSTFAVNAGIATLIHQSANLPANQKQYQYPDSLSSGNYYWTVRIRDQLGNSARSKEGAFQVQ